MIKDTLKQFDQLDSFQKAFVINEALVELPESEAAQWYGVLSGEALETMRAWVRRYDREYKLPLKERAA